MRPKNSGRYKYIFVVVFSKILICLFVNFFLSFSFLSLLFPSQFSVFCYFLTFFDYMCKIICFRKIFVHFLECF